MRKRGLTYVLAAMMLIGSTGIGGTSYVRADEPAITEEGEIETTETEEPTEEVTEEITEEVTEDVTEDVTEEITEETTEEVTEDTTEDSESETTTDVIEISSEMIDDEDQAPVTWYIDYNYVLSGDYIKLKKYIGSSKNVSVPKSATINGKTYITYLDVQVDTDGNRNKSIFADADVETIRFANGFKFPKDSSYLFAYCCSLKQINLKGVDISQVKNMSYMFERCNNLEELDLSGFDMSSVTEAAGMIPRTYGGLTRPTVIYTPINLKVDVGLYPYYFMNDRYGDALSYLPKNMDHSIKLCAYEDYWLIYDEITGWAKVYGKYRYYWTGNPGEFAPCLVRGDLIDNNDTFYFVGEEGYFDDTFTGIARKHSNGHLRFARNGVMDLTFTGLALDPQNHWRFVRNGIMDSTFTGIAQNTNGKWYYCKKGRIDTSFTNMIAKNTNGKYHYCLNGRPTAKFNGIAYCPEVNNWYYCTNGKVDFKTSGIVAPCTNGSWYYVTKSRIDRSFTGIATGTDGKKYYVIKGLVDRAFSGTVTYQGKKYTVVNGVVK